VVFGLALKREKMKERRGISIHRVKRGWGGLSAVALRLSRAASLGELRGSRPASHFGRGQRENASREEGTASV
jgi:hypothetical protein